MTKSNMWADGAAVYEATFTTIQAARGIKSAKQRWSEKSAKETVKRLVKEGKND